MAAGGGGTPTTPVYPAGVNAATESAAGRGDRSSGTCDSCGQPAQDLAEVRRAYLAPDDAGQLVLGEVADEVERWCGSCRSHYPHVPVGDEPGVTGTGEAGDRTGG
jgi:hypothetical protein